MVTIWFLLHLFYHEFIAQFLPFKILIPAQIFSSLIFDRKVFQESLVASILLRHGFLNKDLTILQVANCDLGYDLKFLTAFEIFKLQSTLMTKMA